MLLTRSSRRKRHQPATPPEGFFASPSGSATGDGSIGDPWNLTTAFAGGYPTDTIQPGDTVWLRGGTYTGLFDTVLNGTSSAPITFRNYPGERAILDGNVNPAVPGYHDRVLTLGNWGSWLVILGLEFTHSNVNRMCSPWFDQDVVGDGRDIAIALVSQNSKVINCIMHDTGNGISPAQDARHYDVYGNLIYYNGMYAPFAEQEEAAAVDLAPSGGTAVALSGGYSAQQLGQNPSVTFSHNHTGDYLLVGAYYASVPYTTLSVTYDGVSMTRIVGLDGYSRSVAMFGLATTNTGAHNVVVSTSGAAVVRGIAQSFVNVGSASAGGDWWNNQWATDKDGADAGTYTYPDSYENGATTSSDTNHMVVDVINIYGAHGTGYAPSGDNTGNKIGGAAPSYGNPVVLMSWATRTGAGTVDMSWAWTMQIYPHGHGAYVQSGGHALVATTATNPTITAASGPWAASDVGGRIRIEGAGPAGVDFTSTIQTFNSSSSVTLEAAPSQTLGSTEASWDFASTFRDNITFDNVMETIQLYGSSGSAATGMDVSGNAWCLSPAFFGGLSGFRLTNTVLHDNYFWNVATNIGDAMNNMRNFRVEDNYFKHQTGIAVAPSTWDDMNIEGNTFIGTISGFDSGDFPTNDYGHVSPGDPPATNLVVVRSNAYEANRANIYVYNWEDLTTVDVDLTGAVAPGVAINIMNARDYFAAPVWTGTYSGGSVTLPMTGLTVAAAIGGEGGTPGAIFTPQPSTAPAFAAFIVRAQSEETWR